MRRARCSFRAPAQIAWKFPLEFVEITPGVPDEVLGFAIRTAEVVHQSGAPSTAVRLMQDGKVLSYSGDTEWTDALIPIADGADLFIVECYDYDRAIPRPHEFFRPAGEARRASCRGASCSPI